MTGSKIARASGLNVHHLRGVSKMLTSRRRCFSSLLCASAAVLALPLAGTATAGPITYQLQASTYGGETNVGLTEGSVSSLVSRPVSAEFYLGSARVSPGSIGTLAYSQALVGGYGAAASSAFLHYDDLIISSIDPAATTVNAILNLHLDFSSESAFDGEPLDMAGGYVYTGVSLSEPSRARANVSWNVQLAGISYSGASGACMQSLPDYSWALMGSPCNPALPGAQLSIDRYANFTLEPGLRLAFTLPVGVPLAGAMSLSSSTEVSAQGRAQAQVDFLNTMSFALTGPVFDLPAGFTVNSPSLGIVDNRWIFAPQQQPPSAPEPSLLFLMGAGAAAMLRRRHQ